MKAVSTQIVMMRFDFAHGGGGRHGGREARGEMAETRAFGIRRTLTRE